MRWFTAEEVEQYASNEPHITIRVESLTAVCCRVNVRDQHDKPVPVRGLQPLYFDRTDAFRHGLTAVLAWMGGRTCDRPGVRN